jgi:hypothetical protein
MNATNSSPAVKPATRKPRPKPARAIRILEQPTAETDGWGAVQITVGKKSDRYLVRFIPTDFNGALALEVEKLDADLATVEQYHVSLSDREEDKHCSCKGCLQHGHCKHCDGLAKLVGEAHLKTPRRAKDFHCPRCGERTEGGYCLKCFHELQEEESFDRQQDEPPQLDEAAYFDPADDDIDSDFDPFARLGS